MWLISALPLISTAFTRSHSLCIRTRSYGTIVVLIDVIRLGSKTDGDGVCLRFVSCGRISRLSIMNMRTSIQHTLTDTLAYKF